MQDIYSKTGMVLSILGGSLYLIGYHSWQMDDGTVFTIAPYFASVLAMFSSDPPPQGLSFSQGFSLTEELSIQITIGFSVLLAVVAIILSALAYSKNENQIFVIACMFAGVGVFILISLKLGLIILLIASSIGVYLKQRRTRS